MAFLPLIMCWMHDDESVPYHHHYQPRSKEEALTDSRSMSGSVGDGVSVGMQNPAPGAIRSRVLAPTRQSICVTARSQRRWRVLLVAGERRSQVSAWKGGRWRWATAECGWGLTADSVAFGMGQGLPSPACLRRGGATVWSHSIGRISAHGPADVAGGSHDLARLAAAGPELLRGAFFPFLLPTAFPLPLSPCACPTTLLPLRSLNASHFSRAFGPQFGLSM